MLATAEALLAVAILVAVSWAILHRAQNRVPTQLADLMRKVRTIHYVAVEYFANAKPLHREQWIKFPDKLRSDVKGNNIWIINGDRELSITPYISPPQAELDYAERGIGINSDGWTEPGIRRALHARGTRILKESVEAQPRGRPLLVIEAYREEPGHRLQEWIRYKIDRRSGLLASRVSFEKRFVGRQQLKSRSILQRIEYNRDLPDSLFSLAIPKGVVLKYDLTTPAGIRKYLEDRLGELEKEPPAQRAAIAKEWKRYGADKSIEQRLQRLPPADREAFRERYKRLGILD